MFCCSARLFFCISVLLASWARGDDISLVRVGEAWRYYRGTNEPSATVMAWRQLDFDDSSWQEGASAFSATVYSDTAEATLWNQLPPSPISHSFYHRRKFTVTDPQAVKWLILRLDYTHGFVAYLNGQEIVRRGLTNDPVAHDDYADYHFSSVAEEFDVSAFSGLLNAGENVLAIQVHTAVTNPPGYASSMRLVPELLANFQRGPFVANAATNSIQVIWRTPVTADSRVEYGTTTGYGSVGSSVSLEKDHRISLQNLLPGTVYHYRVESVNRDGIHAVSPDSVFATPSRSPTPVPAVTNNDGHGDDGGSIGASAYLTFKIPATEQETLPVRQGQGVLQQNGTAPNPSITPPASAAGETGASTLSENRTSLFGTLAGLMLSNYFIIIVITALIATGILVFSIRHYRKRTPEKRG